MNKKRSIFVLLSLSGFNGFVNADGYKFEPSLLLGDGYNTTFLENKLKASSGETLNLDIFVNGKYITRSLMKIYSSNDSYQACITPKLAKQLGVKNKYILIETIKDCGGKYAKIKGANLYFDKSKLKAEFKIPDLYINKKPRGYINKELWDPGVTAFYSNYYISYYNSDSNYDNNDSVFVNLDSGLNVGLFRIRNSLNYNSNSDNIKSSMTYGYMPLARLDSELVIGEYYTQGTLFSSLPFTGVQVKSDKRMRPESQQGYAPDVTGIAQTTANVKIYQNNRLIYQTTVAPGPFRINDLYATNYMGDLNVEVEEANGEISTFTVPYSAVPGSQRVGQSEYAMTIGKTRDLNSDDYFFDAFYDYGLTNNISINTATRFSEDYFGASVGSVINSKLGAVGINSAYSLSQAKFNNNRQETQHGWKVGANYSKSFNTGTSLTLAGYKYSSDGYRELGDIIDIKGEDNDNNYYSSTYMQKDEFTFTMNQDFDKYGLFYISATKRNFRNNTDSDEMYRLGYNKNFGGIALALNYARQYSGGNYSNNVKYSREKDDIISMSLSIPLWDDDTLSTTFANSSSGQNTYSASMSGLLDEAKTLNYSISATRQDGGSFENINTLSASLGKRYNIGEVNAGVSHSDDYTQYNFSVRGGVVAHSDGVLLAQHLSDSFAIVEAKGAEGAKLDNGWGAEINSSGYGVAKSLIPYRSNNVSISSGEMNSNVELLNTENSITPYAGSIVKVNFDTRKGKPLLLNIKQSLGNKLPIGSDILDQDGNIIGAVGQGGLAYVLVPTQKGKLSVVTSEKELPHCFINYQLTEEQFNSVELTKQSGVCK
ncbi:fimbria/pilus outer membrane usher protein [Photobacterium damselae]|uniref:fimbria/pilus outer membrane usher protein n=1 Tax=Photobacterium damselae TaxID=38293 RepID=UPI000D07BDAA|nr:fimbria/pilus outer membrane usher protein [Photobacterium damselae]PSB84772.1 fimbrial biogenesis outer membrane usher protein [Photobacterium damselae subsp. damselae]